MSSNSCADREPTLKVSARRSGEGGEHRARTRGVEPQRPTTNAAASFPDEARRAEFVKSLQRGFAVILAFREDRTHLSITDVAQATGLSRAVARRFLLTLVELGYVRSEGRLFSLRPRILELGYAYFSGFKFPDLAQPFMEELSAKVQESTSAAVLDSDEVVYVANVVPRRVMTINVPIGKRDPAYCTALGRVLLAARSDEEIDAYLYAVKLERYTDATVTDPKWLREILRRVHLQGYALVDHELEDGLVAIAVPVHDTAGAVVAAMNVSAYSLRASVDVLTGRFLPLLRATVAEIEEELRSSVVLMVPPPDRRGPGVPHQAGRRRYGEGG